MTIIVPAYLNTYRRKRNRDRHTQRSNKMNTQETKTCTTCKEDKSENSFYLGSNKKRVSSCKSCYSHRQNTYYATNTPYNITNRTRTRCLQALKEKGFNSKGISYEELFGCDREQFISTIINMAEEKGLTVDSMEVDHIIPLYFASNEDHLRKLMKIDNIQVLSKDEHRAKSSRECKIKKGGN